MFCWRRCLRNSETPMSYAMDPTNLLGSFLIMASVSASNSWVLFLSDWFEWGCCTLRNHRWYLLTLFESIATKLSMLFQNFWKSEWHHFVPFLTDCVNLSLVCCTVEKIWNKQSAYTKINHLKLQQFTHRTLIIWTARIKRNNKFQRLAMEYVKKKWWSLVNVALKCASEKNCEFHNPRKYENAEQKIEEVSNCWYQSKYLLCQLPPS